MKKIFIFPRLKTKDFCLISMLIAITVILAVFFTFRPVEQIKIPTKFISVFLASFLFGPWIGGFCGALGDILNILLVPSGAPLPLLTLFEFLSGFVFGVLFYNQKTDGKSYIFRCFVCTIIQFFVDIVLTSAVLAQAGIFPTFYSAIIFKFGVGLIKAVFLLIVLLLGRSYLKIFIKFRSEPL